MRSAAGLRAARAGGYRPSVAAHSTASDPHGLHDWHSRSYVDEWISSDATDDERRLRWLRRLVAMLPFDPSAAIRVLDVGAGYGLLTGEVGRRFPQAVITAHDFSEPMLA